ncbi:MAG: PIN domain-containing protein [Rubrobacteridae bacterium]|nr:PIN domain-containing protein [Rubrobacteridae bacterium]
MKLRVYVDTSVIGGCLDEEFEYGSLQLINRFKNEELVVVISELTLLELEAAPKEVRAVLEELPNESIEYVMLDKEAADLAKKYIAEGIVGKSMLVDAQHIAIATMNRVDVLVSWNFKHIVNLHKIHGFNAVNLKAGYPMLEIRNPREVITYEE